MIRAVRPLSLFHRMGAIRSAAILVNGQFSSSVSAADRGLSYGDGLFETIQIRKGRALLWDDHIQRLHHGCIRLGISTEGLRQRIEADFQVLLTTVDNAKYTHGVFKVIVTRGEGLRGYFPTPDNPTTTVSQISSAPDWSQQSRHGISVRTCKTPLSINPLLAGIKHLNRLEQVIARGEWDDPVIAEGLMMDTEGFLVEGTMSNLFFIRDGVLHTPLLDRCGIVGVVRQAVLKIAQKEGIQTREERYRLDDLLQSTEVFLCNSVIDICPVVRLGNVEWPVGGLTQTLQSLLEKEYCV